MVSPPTNTESIGTSSTSHFCLSDAEDQSIRLSKLSTFSFSADALKQVESIYKLYEYIRICPLVSHRDLHWAHFCFVCFCLNEVGFKDDKMTVCVNGVWWIW